MAHNGIMLPGMTLPRQRIELPDDIVARLRAREEAAYQQLIDRVGPALVNFATQMLGSDDEAHDVVQDVLYRVWQQGERFMPVGNQGNLVAYLFAAVRHRVLNTLRHKHVVAVAHTTLAADVVRAEDRSIDGDMEESDNILRLRHVLATLTEHQRTAFMLRFDQELSNPEIAHILGISVKGVERLMTRARQLLRERFFAADRPAE